MTTMKMRPFSPGELIDRELRMRAKYKNRPKVHFKPLIGYEDRFMIGSNGSIRSIKDCNQNTRAFVSNKMCDGYKGIKVYKGEDGHIKLQVEGNEYYLACILLDSFKGIRYSDIDKVGFRNGNKICVHMDNLYYGQNTNW